MKPQRQAEDPILSPQEMADDAGISEATWYRNYRYHPKLKIIQMSPRRIGARKSDWRRALDQRAKQPA
jgi:hypothetical protein